MNGHAPAGRRWVGAAAWAWGLSWAAAGVACPQAVSAGVQPPAAATPGRAHADDAIPTPLTSQPGDPGRGRAIVVDRQLGMCLLCHSGPFPEERTPGNLATSLAGAGSRWSPAQLRLRIVDGRRLDPQGFMPAFHRTEGLNRVPAAAAGRPLLDAQQVEDVVAFLATLKD